jgi:hypothetical protein
VDSGVDYFDCVHQALATWSTPILAVTQRVSMKNILFVLAAFVLSAVFLVSSGRCQAQAEKGSTKSRYGVTTLTGILLVGDGSCDKRSDMPEDKRSCSEVSSEFGLITLDRQYSVHGKTDELKLYERRRVTVTGSVSPSQEKFMDRLDVQSIRSSEMLESQVREFIEQLKHESWAEPQNIANPTTWVFNFTRPMLQILQAGPAAQDVLLQYLDDPKIKDQIIILLGGVGDQKAVAPIIRAMADRNEARDNDYARKVNLAADLALTNITAGDVIWHHGGGITSDACPDDPKTCWYAWWIQRADTFDVSKPMSRNYSNYPGYGIYQAPRSFRAEAIVAPHAQ